jgi:hypothetical protein
MKELGTGKTRKTRYRVNMQQTILHGIERMESEILFVIANDGDRMTW